MLDNYVPFIYCISTYCVPYIYEKLKGNIQTVLRVFPLCMSVSYSPPHKKYDASKKLPRGTVTKQKGNMKLSKREHMVL